MKIAILGAMEEEITPILDKIGYEKVVEYADNKYYLSKYENHELVIANSKIGKVNSTISTCVMFEKFGCDCLLFTGVAGALNPDFKIGDLVYATKLVQADIDISAFGHPLGYIPGNEVFVNTTKRLNDIALKIAKEQNIDLKQAVISTTDRFICDADTKNWLVKNFGADATEMEGASVARACESFKKDFFILRAISDEAGGGAEFDFDEFLHHSAKISAEFILKMCKSL